MHGVARVGYVVRDARERRRQKSPSRIVTPPPQRAEAPPPRAGWLVGDGWWAMCPSHGAGSLQGPDSGAWFVMWAMYVMAVRHAPSGARRSE
jgi:hypothetical protein